MSTRTVLDVLRGPESAFWARVEKTDSCWFWIGTKNLGGYGVLTILAHRLAYELGVGQIGKGKVIMHTCDNPSCVNPSHLKTGSPQENTLDSLAKGRRRLRDKYGRRHLTDHEIQTIRQLYLSKERTVRELAEQFGVHTRTIQTLTYGDYWK